MIGDEAYDSALREQLDELGTKPVIPNRSNRKHPFNFSKRVYSGGGGHNGNGGASPP
jgi:hypothetical protein